MKDESLERDLEIVNEYGLHLRPAGRFVKVASRFASEVRVSVDGGEEVDGKSLLALATQAAEKGRTIRVRVRGADAREALEALTRLVAGGFAESGEEE